MEIKGKITDLKTEKGISKSGNEWKKINVIIKTEEEYNNLYSLEFFGSDHVENITNNYKIDDSVSILFNIRSTKWNDKFFNNLSGQQINKIENSNTTEKVNIENNSSDLPF